MSVEKIHLRKLLQLFYLPPNKRTSALRADIRNEKKKAAGLSDGGGDFHSPFWADAKLHVAGSLDLGEQAAARIASNKGRERLYPLLAKGFLTWWNEKRRWRNEPFVVIPQSVKAQLPIREFDAVVKIENLLALRIGDQSSRIIYPYFSEEPTLPVEGVRIGLWVMSQSLSYPLEDLRILDVLRGASFGTIDHALQGNEDDLFRTRYKNVLDEWEKLWEEYS